MILEYSWLVQQSTIYLYSLNFHFEYIEFLPALAILPIVIILFVWVLFRKKSILRKIGNPSLVRTLTRSYSPKNYAFKFILLLLAAALLIVALMNPQRPGSIDNIQRTGIDVVIALDVSKSMLAEDIKPTRLEKAKQLLYKLLDVLPDDRIGMVLFAGHAYLQMPLTTDHSAARIYIQNASPLVVPTQGTVIGEALRMSNSAFNSKERKFKSIILITDGEDHDEEAQSLGTTLANNGVMVNTIGIGSPEGSTILDPSTDSYKKDALGQPVVSKLNEGLLQQIATTSNGIYIRLDKISDAVKEIRTQLDTIEKSPMEDAAFRNYESYYYWLAAIALLFLTLEFIWPEKKWRTA